MKESKTEQSSPSTMSILAMQRALKRVEKEKLQENGKEAVEKKISGIKEYDINKSEFVINKIIDDIYDAANRVVDAREDVEKAVSYLMEQYKKSEKYTPELEKLIRDGLIDIFKSLEIPAIASTNGNFAPPTDGANFDKIKQKSTPKIIETPQMKRLTKKERIFMAISSLWLFLNVIIYFMSTPIKNAKSILYPFERDYWSEHYPLNFSNINVYDFTELLIYGISPFVLFAIYKLFLKKEQ